MRTLILAALVGMAVNATATEVDIEKSAFVWKGTKVTGGHSGNIYLKSSSIQTNDAGKIQGGELIMNMDSITVTELSGKWETKFLGHIKSADFFDIEKFPISKLEIKDDSGKRLTGLLTIKGKTHPVSFEYKKEGQSYKGTLNFDRTKFDMVYGSGNYFKNLGDKMIHNNVSVNINLVFK